MTEKRYERNLGTIGKAGQEKLANSSVAIVGAGGLGGGVFEILVRTGVGKIKIIDCDVFDETNLNRQLLSSVSLIGTRKVDAAYARALEVNPGVKIIPVFERLEEKNAAEILFGADVVCDCVDSIDTRFIIEHAAGDLRIPLVHAAIAGYECRIAAIFPSDMTLEAIYGDPFAVPSRGIETSLGTPAFTAMQAAAIQAMETIRIITTGDSILRKRLLRIELDKLSSSIYALP